MALLVGPKKARKSEITFVEDTQSRDIFVIIFFLFFWGIDVMPFLGCYEL